IQAARYARNRLSVPARTRTKDDASAEALAKEHLVADFGARLRSVKSLSRALRRGLLSRFLSGSIARKSHERFGSSDFRANPNQTSTAQRRQISTEQANTPPEPTENAYR